MLQPLAAPLRAAAGYVRDGIAKGIAIPKLPDPADAASQPIATEVARAATAIGRCPLAERPP